MENIQLISTQQHKIQRFLSNYSAPSSLVVHFQPCFLKGIYACCLYLSISHLYLTVITSAPPLLTLLAKDRINFRCIQRASSCFLIFSAYRHSQPISPSKFSLGLHDSRVFPIFLILILILPTLLCCLTLPFNQCCSQLSCVWKKSTILCYEV